MGALDNGFEIPEGRELALRLVATVPSEGGTLESQLDVRWLAPQQVVQMLREIADDIENGKTECDCDGCTAARNN